MINYNDKRFKPVQNSPNGEVALDDFFHYKQIDNVIYCSYSGQNIIKGHLLGMVKENGELFFKYHQINKNYEILIGECKSIPEIMENGKIRLHESWKWTSGDQSYGNSILEEV